MASIIVNKLTVTRGTISGEGDRKQVVGIMEHNCPGGHQVWCRSAESLYCTLGTNIT